MLQAVISAKEIAMAREEIATAKAFVSILYNDLWYLHMGAFHNTIRRTRF